MLGPPSGDPAPAGLYSPRGLFSGQLRWLPGPVFPLPLGQGPVHWGLLDLCGILVVVTAQLHCPSCASLALTLGWDLEWQLPLSPSIVHIGPRRATRL